MLVDRNLRRIAALAGIYTLFALTPATNAEMTHVEGQTLVLPIRVLVHAGTPEADAIAIASEAPHTFVVNGVPDRIYMVVNLPGYRDKTTGKVSFQVNGGAWRTIDSSYDQYCVGISTGPECTVAFMRNSVFLDMPAFDVVQGVNTIAFRLNHKELPSRSGLSGSRIVDFNVLDTGRNRLVDTRVESKTEWPQVAADAVNGEAKFVAVCQDCHLDGGQMMADFGAHPYTMFTQSAKGIPNGDPLTEQDAWDIAAFIQQKQAEKVAAVQANHAGEWTIDNVIADMWDPPLQPGPPLETAPTELYGMGAGLEWTAPSEGDLYAYVQRELGPMGVNGDLYDFQNSPTTNFDHNGYLNLNILPRPIQFPGWQAWVPTVEVADICGDGATYFAYLEDIARNIGANKGQLEGAMSDAKALFTGPVRGSCFGAEDNWVEHEAKIKAAALAILTYANRVGYDTIADMYSGFEGDKTGPLAADWGMIFFWALHKSSKNDIGGGTCWVYPDGVVPVGNCSGSARGSWQTLLAYSLQAHFGMSDTKPWGSSMYLNLGPFEPYDAKYAYGFLADGQMMVGTGLGIQTVLESTRLQQVNDHTWDENAWKERHTNPYPFVRAFDNGDLSLLSESELGDIAGQHMGGRTRTLYRFFGCTGEGLNISCTFAGISRGGDNSQLQGEVTAADCQEKDSGTEFKKDTCYYGLRMMQIMQSNGSDMSVREMTAGVYSAAFPDARSLFEGTLDGYESPDPPLRALWTPGNEGTPPPPPPPPPPTNVPPAANFDQTGSGLDYTFTSTSTDADGQIVSTEWVISDSNENVLATGTGESYTITFPASGTYEIELLVTDDDGAFDELAVTVDAVSGGGSAPTVSISAPSDNATFVEPASIAVSATASDVDGNVTKVVFLVDGSSIGEDSAAPFAVTWMSPAVGSHQLTAQAEDNSGSTTLSAAVTVTIEAGSGGGEGVAPTAAIDSPTNNDVFVDASAIDIEVSAADTDGSVDKVIFLVNDVTIGEDTTSPFSVVWNSPAVGTHALTAQALDNDGNATTSSSVTVVVESSGGDALITQNISLQTGWNIVSAYVQPNPASMEDVFADVEEVLRLVKDEDGDAFAPSRGIDDIGDWEATSSYFVSVSSPQTLSIEGEAVNPALTPVDVSAGWNVVPYLRTDEMSIDEALASVTSSLVLLKDYAGNLYYPEYGINEIGTLKPGQGYKLYSSSTVQLSYPANTAAPGEMSGSTAVGVASTALLVLDSDEIADGVMVSVARPTGEVVGRGYVFNGRAIVKVIGDDVGTESAQEGAREGEPLMVMTTVPGDDVPTQVRAANAKDALAGMAPLGALTYSEDAVLVADLVEAPVAITLEQNYPNPFRPTTQIEFGIPNEAKVALEVYNLLGERVAVIVDDRLPAGFYSYRFAADGLASGIYLYRLKADLRQETRRMVLLK